MASRPVCLLAGSSVDAENLAKHLSLVTPGISNVWCFAERQHEVRIWWL